MPTLRTANTRASRYANRWREWRRRTPRNPYRRGWIEGGLNDVVSDKSWLSSAEDLAAHFRRVGSEGRILFYGGMNEGFE